MYLKCLLTVLLSVLVTGQSEDVFNFYRGRLLLSKCIEDYLSKSNSLNNTDERNNKVIANVVARRFFGRNETAKSFNNRANILMYDLKRRQKLLKNNQINKLTQWLIKEALIYCADGQSILTQTVPTFENEPPELANVLDYILVDWPFTLEWMIGARYGRALFRRYAKEAETALDKALAYVLNHHNFRVIVRELWMRRAYSEFPYIRHRYTIREGLCFQSNIQNSSFDREFSRLNSQVLQSVTYVFLKVHEADRPPYVKHDIFHEYERNGMTDAEYYIESRIDQFYLILLYARKLQVQGISSDDEDIHNKFVPYHILNRNYQLMLFNNAVYRNILINSRDHVYKIHKKLIEEAGKEIVEVFSHTLDHEECLIIMWMFSANNYSNFLTLNIEDYEINDHGEYLIEMKEYSKFRLVPVFTDEPQILTDVLDYILVDWLTPLYSMICSREGRVVLRKYANDALLLLERALNYVADHEYLRFLFRSYWMKRAQYYFDGRNSQVPYLRHHYSLENPFPHTYDSATQLFSRNAHQFLDRNPCVSQEEFLRIMRIHCADRPGYSEFDVFSGYERDGFMRSAEYYIETHIDQFYRIIFFFIEMRTHGISSNEEDIYDGTLPFEIMPFKLQEIVYDDQAYRKYLLSIRTLLENSMLSSGTIESEVLQSLSRARVNEEDLISLMNLWLTYDSSGDAIINIPTTTSTTRTTPMYEGQLKRKGSVWVNHKGKHFCKSPKTNETTLHIQTDEHGYGMITHNGDYTDQQNFTTEEMLMVLKMHGPMFLQSHGGNFD